MISSGYSALDLALTGGLHEKRDYLVYGSAGMGKTTFALGFLDRGLSENETAVLVTRRPPGAILRQAQAFGLDLEPHVQAGRLLIFEYPDDVLENASRLRDDSRIVDEFRRALDGHAVKRVVFDPVTPLLAGPTLSSSAFRCRRVTQAFASFQATCLYIIDTPEGEQHLAGCLDCVDGVLRFEAGAWAGRNRIVVERYPELTAATHLEFELKAGAGLVDAPAAAPDSHGKTALSARSLSAGLDRFPSAPMDRLMRQALPLQNGYAGSSKILVVDPDPAQRAQLAALLGVHYTVLEAGGVADGMALTGAESPDLLLLSLETKGIDGCEMTRRLRQNGKTLPIVLIGNRIRRTRDRAHMLAAGADVCLERPVDGRILKLHIHNLLRRPAAPGHFSAPAPPFEAFADITRDSITCTTELDYFCDRILEEAAWCREHALSCAVIALRMPRGNPAQQELAAVTSFLTRGYDLTYLGEHGVAVLLAETETVQPFLDRFAARWATASSPAVSYRRFTGDNFVDVVRQFVAETIGIRRTAAGSVAGNLQSRLAEALAVQAGADGAAPQDGAAAAC